MATLLEISHNIDLALFFKICNGQPISQPHGTTCYTFILALTKEGKSFVDCLAYHQKKLLQQLSYLQWLPKVKNNWKSIRYTYKYFPKNNHTKKMALNQGKQITRLHIHSINLPISSKKSLQIRLSSIVLKVSAEYRPHCTWTQNLPITKWGKRGIIRQNHISQCTECI